MLGLHQDIRNNFLHAPFSSFAICTRNAFPSSSRSCSIHWVCSDNTCTLFFFNTNTTIHFTPLLQSRLRTHRTHDPEQHGRPSTHRTRRPTTPDPHLRHRHDHHRDRIHPQRCPTYRRRTRRGARGLCDDGTAGRGAGEDCGLCDGKDGDGCAELE